MQPYEVQAYGLLGTFNTWYTSHNISAIIKRKEEEWATDGFSLVTEIEQTAPNSSWHWSVL